MYGYNPYRNPAVVNELLSDVWIEQNVPGGLSSPLGRVLDNAMGGNPNPTVGQLSGNYGWYGYGNGYGYRYGTAW